MDTALRAPDRRYAVCRVSDGETVLRLPTMRHCTRSNIVSCGNIVHLADSIYSYQPAVFSYRTPVGARDFFFFKTPRLALGPIQPTIQWVPELFHGGLNRPGRELDHLTPSTVEVNEWSYTFTPQYALMTWTGTALPFTLSRCLLLITYFTDVSSR